MKTLFVLLFIFSLNSNSTMFAGSAPEKAPHFIGGHLRIEIDHTGISRNTCQYFSTGVSCSFGPGGQFFHIPLEQMLSATNDANGYVQHPDFAMITLLNWNKVMEDTAEKEGSDSVMTPKSLDHVRRYHLCIPRYSTPGCDIDDFSRFSRTFLSRTEHDYNSKGQLTRALTEYKLQSGRQRYTIRIIEFTPCKLSSRRHLAACQNTSR